MAQSTTSKLVLYTNHNCPYCHRVHIALSELGIAFEEHIIDLNSPRPQWYLDINPKGLVPALIVDGEIITESTIITQYLCDAFPSHLLPATSKDPQAALTRARVNEFLDTWDSKVGSKWFGILMQPTEEARQANADEFVGAVEKGLDPLLRGANPFFGGSEKLTLVECFAAPFVLRMYALSEHGELIPSSLAEKLNALPNFGPWAAALKKEKSVTDLFDAEATLDGMRKLVVKLKGSK